MCVTVAASAASGVEIRRMASRASVFFIVLLTAVGWVS
jgi:hypothetical protein